MIDSKQNTIIISEFPWKKRAVAAILSLSLSQNGSQTQELDTWAPILTPEHGYEGFKLCLS